MSKKTIPPSSRESSLTSEARTIRVTTSFLAGQAKVVTLVMRPEPSPGSTLPARTYEMAADELLTAAEMVEAHMAQESDKRFHCPVHGFSAPPSDSWSTIYDCPTCEGKDNGQTEPAK